MNYMASALVGFLASNKRVVLVPTVSRASFEVKPFHIWAFQTELAANGWALSHSLRDALAAVPLRMFTQIRAALMQESATLVGADKKYSVLFKSFPHDLPDTDEYFFRRMSGFLGVNPDDAVYLSCGHGISAEEATKFGACPVCQEQVPELTGIATAQADSSAKTTLRVLSVVTEADVWAIFTNLLSARSSLTPVQLSFIEFMITEGHQHVLAHLPATIPFKETMAYVIAQLGKQGIPAGALAGYIKTPTDVLRIATAASGGDCSLATNTKFKLTNQMRRFVLCALNEQNGSTDELLSEMVGEQGRWLRLGEVLHVGTAKSRVPNAYTLFTELRCNASKHKTFGSKVHNLVAQAARKGAGKLAVSHAEQMLKPFHSRPGELIRRVDAFLNRGVPAELLAQFILSHGEAIGSGPMLSLLGVIESRQESAGNRVFFPKGSSAKAWVTAGDSRREWTVHEASVIKEAVESALRARFAKMPALGNVFVHPSLNGLLVPSALRNASNGLTTLPRGSRMALAPNQELVRLFLHWSGPADVDLSAMFMDSAFSMQGQVSWTCNAYGASKHSGDIRSATGPNGAAEFIDLDLYALRKEGIRYAVIMVYSYSGELFNELNCSAGFMARDYATQDTHFEAHTVQHRFGLTAAGRTAAPMVLDLATNEVVWTDMAFKGSEHGSVHSQSAATMKIIRHVTNLVEQRVSLAQLFQLHAQARGKLVPEASMADVVLDDSMLFKLDEVLAHWL